MSFFYLIKKVNKMIVMEIMKDAFNYPLKNIKALVLYLILGIILGVVIALTAAAVIAGVENNSVLTVVGLGLIGTLISVFLAFVISGYGLDVIKYGIERNSGAPGIDIVRQSINGVKLLVVDLVYFIIPIIIAIVLALIFNGWLANILSVILFIIFALAAFMAQCRLAKSEDIMDALDIGEAISDIARVGILNLILFAVIVFVVAFIVYFIVSLIIPYNAFVGGILEGIVGIYLSFFVCRATGLLYSTV